MRSRMVLLAFPEPTHLCSKSSLVFSLIFSVCLRAILGKIFVLAFSNPLPSPTFFLYSFLMFFLPLTLFFTQPAISPPFLSHLSFDFIFFPFKILCNLSFLALWCSFSSAIVIASPFSLSCFYLLHIKSFQSFHLLHSCTFQPAGCFRKLCNHSSCDHAFILFLLFISAFSSF